MSETRRTSLSQSGGTGRFTYGEAAHPGDRRTLDLDTAFERYHDALFRYLHRLTGDADVAGDLAQESFVRLLDYEISDGRVRSWLFTVATNLVRDHARTRARRRRLLDGRDLGPNHPPRADVEVERAERVEAVRRALDRLNERDRRLLLLREEGFSYREIAEVVGVAPGSVGQLLVRSLNRFAREYEDAGGSGAEGGSRGESDPGRESGETRESTGTRGRRAGGTDETHD